MLFNRLGLVFVGQRMHIEAREAWQMPQGGIDPGEELEAAALRELKEETGITSVQVLEKSPDWYYYDLPKEEIGRALKGKYRGQTQMWFALRFIGDDAEIDLTQQKPQEFNQFRWVSIDDLVPMIVEFKRDVYRRVVADFRKFANPL